MKNLRFICAQPSTMYYAWQVEVMINNFIEMGVNPNFIDIVSKITILLFIFKNMIIFNLYFNVYLTIF